MSNPTSLLSDVVGFARDHALDDMPRGLVWDMADYLPDRRGAKLEGRGPWSYFSTSAIGGEIWGGKHAAFRQGTKLFIGGAGTLYEVNLSSGAVTTVGAVPNSVQNGVMLANHLFFCDAAGVNQAKYIGYDNSIGNLPATSPPGGRMCVYKGRLVLARVADPLKGNIVYFSPLQDKEDPVGSGKFGPAANWDPKSFIASGQLVTALASMTGQILVFHHSSIERIRGGMPPGEDLDTDMSMDVFSEEIGTDDPGSVVYWQENVCFAGPHGVFLTDGATIRSLTDQGGIGNLWRELYKSRRPGHRVTACVFKDLLFVTVLTTWGTSTAEELRPMTLVCDLVTRVWLRLKNVHATCYIDSMIDEEEVWWGVDPSVPSLGANRVAKLSPLLFGRKEFDPEGTTPTAPDAVDGNGLAVLPSLRTGWQKLGPEGVKRMRHVYVSHVTQAQTQNLADVLQVRARLSPYPNLDTYIVGQLPANPRYTRKRLRIDRRAYGIQIEVEQVLPSYLSRIYDISVDNWAQDRGKL